jgi:hypothetical protein
MVKPSGICRTASFAFRRQATDRQLVPVWPASRGSWLLALTVSTMVAVGPARGQAPEDAAAYARAQ